MRASEFLPESISTGQGGGSAGKGGGQMMGGPTTYEQEYNKFKRKGPRRITAMTYESAGNQTITLADIYSEYPDHDEMIWNYVGDSDFDIPFTIQTINPNRLNIYLTSQYRIEHVEELFDMMDEDQRETVEHYENDPTLSNQIIVMSDGRIIDGNHRALAAVLANKPIKYIDVSEDV